jgi:hypothetical protein
VVTGDESWGFEYYPNTTHHSEECTVVTAMPEESKKVQIKNQVKIYLIL